MINYLKQKIITKINHQRIESLLSNEDFLPIENIRPERIKTVVFVIARMLKFSGGYTSILRLGTQIAKHNIKVYYAVTSKRQSIEEARKNAGLNLSDFKGEIIKFSDIESISPDVVIATYWRTVYETKHINAYRMYFVQDYEPYFTQYGEQYLLARKTYDMGYHMVSLGQWNKYMVERECGKKEKFDYIDFPFEPSEYKFIKRDYSKLKDKNSYTMAAFIKTDQKRLPNIINAMLGNLTKEFEKHGKKLNVKFFGIDKSFNVNCGENLGILNKQQLFDLYKEADFGICASMTNVSLVPYEMLATGLPLIEFQDGTFPFFFPNDTAVLTGFSYKELYEKLDLVIKKPELAEKMIETAQEYLKNLSWEKTGKQFVKIISEI